MSSSSSAAYIDATAGATEHCEIMAQLYTDLSEFYLGLADLCRQKLWHQLSMTVLPFVSNHDSSKNLRTTPEGNNSFLALYDKVILTVDKKLNSLTLARIASAVANSLLSTDGTAAKAVLENLLEQSKRLGIAATLYVESKLHLLTLHLLERAATTPAATASSATTELDKNQLSVIADALKKNASKLQEMTVDMSTTMVHSAHYQCSMKYRKAVGPPEAFYHEAMAYLNYTAMEDMTEVSPHDLAVDITLAALTGEGVYNFGQVVMTPILNVLEHTSESWLMEFMHVMAKGDVIQFQKLSETHAAAIQSQPALVHRATAVKEKMTLLALVNMVFERPSSERVLSLQDIATRIHVDIDQVEWVVMRALSLKLIEGCIDQVDQTVSVTWVMPRVLTTDQCQDLATKIAEWATKVSLASDYMKENTPALFT